MSTSSADLRDAVQAGFRTMPERYLGALPGFDATYRILVGDAAVELRCTEHAAVVHLGASKRRPDVVFSADPATWAPCDAASSPAARRFASAG